MKRKALLVVAVLLTTLAGHAQENVVEQSLVEPITVDPTAVESTTAVPFTLEQTRKKWQLEFDIHYDFSLYGSDHDDHFDSSDINNVLSLRLSLLRNFHPRYTVGVGAGVSTFGIFGASIPVCGTFRYRPLSNPQSSPFYLFTDLGYEWTYAFEEELGNAVLTNWGIGWEKKSKKHHRTLNLQLSFNSKRIPYEDYDSSDKSYPTYHLWMHYLSLGIGWAW